MFWRYGMLLLGVFACSTSVILIKASHAPPTVIAALRLLLAVVLLAPVFWRNWRRHRAAFTGQHVRRALLPAGVLALHFISWSYGARMTAAAQATLIVNLVPVAIPFFLHALLGERINRREILGTALTLVGIVVLTARDVLTGGGDLLGNLVCFGSMLLFAWYLALGRRNRDYPTLWLYVVPVYAFAAVICLVAALPWLNTLLDPAVAGSARDWLILLGMACIPTITGHSLLNAAMRHLRGQIVSLCNVGQFVFAGVMAYFIFHESPTATFYAGSALVVAGIAVVVFSAPTAPPRMR
jgi:drug/metabolite transporter (DMT)-like permease